MKESDWKTFKNSLIFLRERYLKEKNRELLMSLTDENKTATEQFWDTLELMEEESSSLSKCLDNYSRSKMFLSMVSMLNCGMLKKEDLMQYSEELQNSLQRFT